jgi:alanine dehydrogenase
MRLLSDDDVGRFLDMNDCIEAVEAAFRARGKGLPATSAIAGLELDGGTLHAKLGRLNGNREYAVAKINANFPLNPERYGLPTIQGVLVLFDAEKGEVLSVMRSGMLTALRTAAATAVAAKHLALPNASTIAFVGCGTQAVAHLQALLLVRHIERVRAFDNNPAAMERFAGHARATFGISIESAPDVPSAVAESAIVVTSTTARRPLIGLGQLSAGTFVGAVGADNHTKHEIHPELMRAAAVVVDDLDQCSRMGDLHHALSAGMMELRDVRASLDQVVCGTIRGRVSDTEIIVFDSTGVAIEDVAAAAVVHERALREDQGQPRALA